MLNIIYPCGLLNIDLEHDVPINANGDSDVIMSKIYAPKSRLIYAKFHLIEKQFVQTYTILFLFLNQIEVDY